MRFSYAVDLLVRSTISDVQALELVEEGVYEVTPLLLFLLLLLLLNAAGSVLAIATLPSPA